MSARLTRATDRFFMLDQGGRFAAFDGLRAWAILSVFGVHFDADWTARKLEPSIAKDVIGSLTVSHLGVDLFFVLSGFLIYRLIVRTRPDFVSFMKDRYARLLPAHVAVILAGLATSTLMVGVANTFFLNLFVPSMPALNFVTWSLGYEMLFYCIGGLALISLPNPRQFSVIAAGLAFAVAACNALPAGWQDVGFFRVPDIRLMGFFFGVAAAMLYESESYQKIESAMGWLGLAGLAVCLVLSAYVWPRASGILAEHPAFMKLFYLMTDLAFALVCLGAAARAPNFINSAFAWKPLRMLGIISYSFYLCHAKFGISLGHQVADRYFPGHGYVTSYLLGLTASTLIAMFLFEFLEKPYFKRRSERPRVAQRTARVLPVTQVSVDEPEAALARR